MPILSINRTTRGLIFLTALCIAFIAARIILKDNLRYSFLLWNLFLAWIPLLLSQLAYRVIERRAFSVAALFLWLLFFPNAPYIITDLLHLKGYSQNILWFDSLLIFTFAITGLLIGLVSLNLAHQSLEIIFGIET